MTKQPDSTKVLIAEIARYLAVVDFFRALGSEPSWRQESALALYERR